MASVLTERGGIRRGVWDVENSIFVERMASMYCCTWISTSNLSSTYIALQRR